MDIGNLKKVIEQDEEGAVVTIYQTDGEPYKASDDSDCTMTVLGSESKRYRDAERRQQRRFVKRARTGGGGLSPEEADVEAIELAMAAVVDWHGWEIGGKPAECTPANLREVLKYKHIINQVNNAITGHAHFFAKSSES